MKIISTSLTACFALVWVSTAGADIAPDPGDDDDAAEETCSVAVQEEELPGFECQECVSGEVDDCSGTFEGTDYELVCFVENDDSVTEIWCTEEEDGGGSGPVCALTPDRRSAGLAAAMLGLLALHGFRRRT